MKVKKERTEKLRGLMAQEGLDALLVVKPASIMYLTGASIYPFERMWVYIVRKNGNDVLLANKLFVFPDTGIATKWHTDNDDAPAVLCAELGGIRKLGVEKDITAKYILPIMKNYPEMEVVCSECVDDLRRVKEPEELQKMIESSLINDAVSEEVFTKLHEGMTEKELADLVSEGYAARGAEGPCFETIAAFGANAADPHHSSDDTRLKKGDCVLVDMGCYKHGYCSDMTRTEFFGSATEENEKVYNTVLAAQEAAMAIIKPGVRFCDIDKAARDVITEAGYGEYFTHRLGHCIGLQEHEPGDVGPVNTKTVEPGMVFSIEPGIYLTGKFGVRIENLVYVTEDGYRSLNHRSREFRIDK